MIVRQMAFFVKGKKFALAKDVEYTITNNSKRLITDEGDIGATKGPCTTAVKIGSVEPVPGNTMQLEQKVIDSETIDVSLFPVGGKIHHIKGVSISEVTFTGSAEDGSNDGSWQMAGGKPKTVG